MSIYIRGMKMPFCCLVCPCSGESGESESEYVCEAAGCREITKENKIIHRPDWCPLVPVPDHGRLIDGDIAEVISFKKSDAEGKDFYDGILYATDWISEQPTIIPADLEWQMKNCCCCDNKKEDGE